MAKNDKANANMTEDPTADKAKVTNADDETLNAASAPAAGLPAEQAGGAVQIFEDYGMDAGAGMENVTADEYKMPFFSIIQAMSPQCKPVAAGGLGATPGQVMNTGTGEIFDPQDIEYFIPCFRDHNYVGFYPKPPDGPGGFVGIYDIDNPEVLALRAQQGKFGKLKRDKNVLASEEISETYYFYGFLKLKERSPMRGIIAFSISKVPVYQAVMGQINDIKYAIKREDGSIVEVPPPMWAHTWKLGTVFETKKTREYYNWTMVLTGRDNNGKVSSRHSLIKKDDPRYIAARDFHTMLKAGKGQVDYAQQQTADEGQTGGNSSQGNQSQGQPGGVNPDDEIPF